MTDTIAAIATTVGASAINIIKVSGKDAISITNKIFKGKSLLEARPFTITYGHIVDNEEIIDEVLVSIFKSPKSYTGEDVTEINCHGGIACTNKILELLLTNGCRLAEPGEFLKRAFLNGKRNLMEAEAISDLINSKTEEARKMNIKGITGELSKLIKDLREKIVNIIANIEVNIDYPEYEDAILYTNELLKTNIQEIKEDLTNILNKSDKGKLIKDGLNIGIIGKPNVGKSSLLNALLGENKAIVTEIEGTTRDIVEGKITLNGVSLNLIDTAGIRETDNVVEQIGVSKSKETIENADLIIAIFDSSRELNENDKEILKYLNNKKVIYILNKQDLPTKINLDNFKDKEIIKTSLINNKGINEILNKISEMFKLNEIESGDFTYISNARQIALIKEALKLIGEINVSNENNIEVDLIEIDLQSLWSILGEIIGDTYKEELLDVIFSKFCLGK